MSHDQNKYSPRAEDTQQQSSGFGGIAPTGINVPQAPVFNPSMPKPDIVTVGDPIDTAKSKYFQAHLIAVVGGIIFGVILFIMGFIVKDGRILSGMGLVIVICSIVGMLFVKQQVTTFNKQTGEVIWNEKTLLTSCCSQGTTTKSNIAMLSDPVANGQVIYIPGTGSNMLVHYAGNGCCGVDAKVDLVAVWANYVLGLKADMIRRNMQNPAGMAQAAAAQVAGAVTGALGRVL